MNKFVMTYQTELVSQICWFFQLLTSRQCVGADNLSGVIFSRLCFAYFFSLIDNISIKTIAFE